MGLHPRPEETFDPHILALESDRMLAFSDWFPLATAGSLSVLVVRFTNNVVVSADFWYRELDSPKKPGKERMPPCQDRGPLSVPSLTISCKRLSTPCLAEL